MEQAGADLLHVDVMDGHFVPNITIGAPVVRSLRRCVGIPLDVHLMIDDPQRYLSDFASAGADILTIHLEAAGDDPAGVLRRIRSLGVKPCISVKPATPVETVFPLLGEVDMVLIMTVEPGFGGQKLIEDTLPKIVSLHAELQRRGLDADIQVDGGVNAGNIGRLSRAGANVFVAGSAIFGAPDARVAIDGLRAACAG